MYVDNLTYEELLVKIKNVITLHCLCSHLIHLCIVDSSTSLSGQFHFPFKECLVYFSVASFIMEILVLNANSVDIDQTPHSTASDQGLHCLSMSLLWNARLKWADFNLTPNQ